MDHGGDIDIACILVQLLISVNNSDFLAEPEFSCRTRIASVLLNIHFNMLYDTNNVTGEAVCSNEALCRRAGDAYESRKKNRRSSMK